jgi:hypothetical protein
MLKLESKEADQPFFSPQERYHLTHIPGVTLEFSVSNLEPMEGKTDCIYFQFPVPGIFILTYHHQVM